MTEFNQAKFESDAKKLVAKYLNYKVDEKEVFIVWFSKVGANAKAMLSSHLDNRYFEVTHFGEEGVYIVDVYSLLGRERFNEEVIAMKMNDNQHFYSALSKDGSTSQLKVYADKVQVSIVDKIQLSDETKCPICQEYHRTLGITGIFELQVKEDILILTDKSFNEDMRFPKDAFKIKYCPFCGRKL